MRRGARRHVALAYAFSPIPACFGQKVEATFDLALRA